MDFKNSKHAKLAQGPRKQCVRTSPGVRSFRAMISFEPKVTQVQFPTCRSITNTCLRFLQWGKVWEIVKWLKGLKLNPCKCFISIKVRFSLINEDQAVDGIYFNSSDTAYMFHLAPSWRDHLEKRERGTGDRGHPAVSDPSCISRHPRAETSLPHNLVTYLKSWPTKMWATIIKRLVF